MKSVLVVDDALFMREALKQLLAKHGFQVVGEAGNGRDGVKKYIELSPDLVTMDITMPDMTGVEALKEIRSYDPNAKVVMVTALGHELMVKDAVLCGAKSFVVKPFKPEHLIETLSKVAAS